jgi:transaldolase
MPENTLLAFADHGKITGALTPDGGDYQSVLANFKKSGVDLDALALKLQEEGADSFVKSWDDLIGCIEAKLTELRKG